MSMVYCRGCGKEIHETAQTCPHCGATQNIIPPKSTFILILLGIAWASIFWIGGLFLFGAVVGSMHPSQASFAGHDFGRIISLPLLLISAIISFILTKFGKLPGTKHK
jgi:hypothetical protein